MSNESAKQLTLTHIIEYVVGYFLSIGLDSIVAYICWPDDCKIEYKTVNPYEQQRNRPSSISSSSGSSSWFRFGTCDPWPLTRRTKVSNWWHYKSEWTRVTVKYKMVSRLCVANEILYCLQLPSFQQSILQTLRYRNVQYFSSLVSCTFRCCTCPAWFVYLFLGTWRHLSIR